MLGETGSRPLSLPPPPPLSSPHSHSLSSLLSSPLLSSVLIVEVTDDGFLEFFNSFGPVVDSVVMVDRLTRRSRGFGFVTFANEVSGLRLARRRFFNKKTDLGGLFASSHRLKSERDGRVFSTSNYLSHKTARDVIPQNDAIRLLTAIPGKTGYVFINRKQCEVKASTPKTVDGGPVGKHHRPHHAGGAGQWRSNPPHHHRDNNRGYNPHRSTFGGGAVPPPGPARQPQQVAPHDAGAKQTRAGGEFDASTTTASMKSYYDYTQPPSSQAMAPMIAYDHDPAVYHPSYLTAYPAAASSVVPSPYDSPYPAMSQGPGGNDDGYYSPYPYAQYAGQQYGGQQIVTPSPMMAGHHLGYATYSAYDADGGGWARGAPVPPSQGGVGYGFGYEHITQQPYRDGNEHGEDSASAEE